MCMKYNICLCDERLEGRDPNIYCKYRSSCPVWFMQKRQDGWDVYVETENRVVKRTVNFQPDDRETTIPSDEKPIDYRCGL
jgi:hypothetical protein